MEKIFGVVILYQPSQEVIAHMHSYLPLVDKLIVMDNSEPESAIDLNSLGNKAVLIADGINKGIAERLNAAAAMAIDEDAEWLLTMDQDSSFDESDRAHYRQCFSGMQGKEKIAMIGVAYEKKVVAAGCSFDATDMLITSGSLVNLKIHQALGGFDENLFIDEVDFEYCLRANQQGFATVKLKNVHMSHSLGTAFEFRSVKNFKKTSRTLHTPVRLYYMVRNYFYVKSLYHSGPSPSLRIKKKDLLNRIKNHLLYAGAKFKTIRFIIKGFADYKARRMGKMAP
ncbi:glycosyltransferase family 2 protein [Niabella insulamsoli]|uniref:glycosyltransferase family 2 protein n=1 Tax=Niabella insulamsoli TaxID=3144874 RepID=UPI0031FC1F4C